MSKKYSKKQSDKSNSKSYETKEEIINQTPLDQSVTSEDIYKRLTKETQDNLIQNGYSSLFKIQVACFDPIYSGKNLIGQEKTGMGKTLAFLLPVMERI